MCMLAAMVCDVVHNCNYKVEYVQDCQLDQDEGTAQRSGRHVLLSQSASSFSYRR